MEAHLDDAIDLIHGAISCADEEDWEECYGFLEEAMSFLATALNTAEEKMDE